MSEHHHHDHQHLPEATSDNLSFAFWLNTCFAVVEVFGGLFTNSIAILSDALHDFGDSLALGLAWYFHKKSKRKRDKDYSYGYRRFSLLGAFINAILLVMGSLFIVGEAVQRLFAPEQPDARGMFVLAIAGILVNALAMMRLRRGKSMNERVVMLHFVEDVLGWVAVLIASIVMYFTSLPILDPILSILIAGFILFNVFRNLKSALRIVLQARPEDVDEDAVRQEIMSINGVSGVHDLHVWTLDGQFNILTLHVVAEESRTAGELEELKCEVRDRLSRLNLQHATIEMELEGVECKVEEP